MDNSQPSPVEQDRLNSVGVAAGYAVNVGLPRDPTPTMRTSQDSPMTSADQHYIDLAKDHTRIAEALAREERASRLLRAERDRLLARLAEAERELGSPARRFAETQQLRAVLDTAQILPPVETVEVGELAIPLHETKIRHLALKLAGDWKCDDIYGTADEIAEYIATGRYPGKGVADE